MRSLLVVLCLLLAGPVWGEGRTINGEVFERSEDTYNITEEVDGRWQTKRYPKWERGESSNDGCNTCSWTVTCIEYEKEYSCTESGAWCTLIYCGPEPEIVAKAEGDYLDIPIEDVGETALSAVWATTITAFAFTNAGYIWDEEAQALSTISFEPEVYFQMDDIKWGVRDSEGRVHLFEPVAGPSETIIKTTSRSVAEFYTKQSGRPCGSVWTSTEGSYWECYTGEYELQWFHKGIEGGAE
jgi:hypothetical protein